MMGETVIAFVGRKPRPSSPNTRSSPSPASGSRRYKIPSRIQLVDRLPRNQSGKVLKEDLRRPYWEGRPRRVN